MISKQDLVFSRDLYEKFLHGFQLMEQHLGLKLFVHADDEVLKNGQVFLFNHFTRFETVIPVYIFYQRLQAFTRTITDYHLFEMSPRLRDFLCGAGAVPNNLPGLLPFLAAELLKGRKVVIFPEGRMIKDRRVIDDQGRFRIFSESKQAWREHHRGAAVLALTVDLFKRRIKNIHAKGDMERFDRWRKALEFESNEALLQTVVKPTLIVPGTITFTPIRASGNFLSRAIKMLDRDFSDTLLEEIIVEGNILFKNTSMDIRFGDPISIDSKWRWWKNRLLDKYFMSITSLDEFFGLRERAETWSERLLANLIYKETGSIRDEYIKKIYQGLTVNISHVTSVVINSYLESGRRKVPTEELHMALYLTVKELQGKPDVHLHHHLNKPENYSFQRLSKSAGFQQFIDIAVTAELIKISNTHYLLLDKLSQEFSFRDVRRENPVAMLVNEAAPIPEVAQAAVNAITKAGVLGHHELSSYLWDDELRAFAWNVEKYSKHQYHEINQYETAFKASGPFLLTGHTGSRVGILLLHGFLASPSELFGYGEHLHARGFNVLGVRIAGHGTSPYDLNERSWQEWLASVRRGYEILRAFCDEIIIVGFSVGGTLAALFASEKPRMLKAIVCVCAALEVQDKSIKLAPLMHTLNGIVKVFPTIDGILTFKRSNTPYPATNYSSMPVSALKELQYMMKETSKKITAVETPVLIVQSTNDNVVNPASANRILDTIASGQKQLVWIESDNHHILRENIKGTWNVVDAFIDKLHRDPARDDNEPQG